MSKKITQKLTTKDSKELIEILQQRFSKNMHRHPKMKWQSILEKLEANPTKLWSLKQMEDSGGEPDVVFYDKATDEYHFYDCSKETPKPRTSLCYDKEAWNARKEHKPQDNAMDVAQSMGTEILDEEQYFYLQSLGAVDTKTSSWIKTPDPIRKLGGAIFGDWRFGRVFIYHNTAISYYGVRGFRTILKV